MKEAYLNPQSFRYKLAYDGVDLISKPLGDAMIGKPGKRYIQKHCKLNLSNDLMESFIKFCIQERCHSNLDLRGLSKDLCDKYEVGLFIVSEQNCIDGVDYVLFNKEQLTFWDKVGVGILNVPFMVIPSRDWDGKINEIGFRVLDTQLVHNGFKWLFPIGQQATFGLHKCTRNKQLILCEGFLDYIALTESGYDNIVGLGSVELTENHKKQLNTDDWLFCLDMDNYGLKKSSEFIDQNKICFYAPEGKDPYETFQKHGRVKLVYIA